jgi:hypothetical protein
MTGALQLPQWREQLKRMAFAKVLLAGRLRRAQTFLRSLGIEITFSLAR